MVHEGVIRLNVPDALLSEIGHSAVLSICGDVFLWVEKRKETAAFPDTKRHTQCFTFDDTRTHIHWNPLSIV